MDDIEQIAQDLKVIEKKWSVTPRLRRMYVRS
jgi:hypothetical protein